MFEVSMEAPQHNADLLRHHECNIAQFLDGQRGTTLDFGSEFRPAQGAMVQPTGLAEQWVLDNNGKRKVKHRIT
jgi:hypothetical protein